MDVDLPGTYVESHSSDLETPIRRIKNFRINSPDCKSPIYPDIDDLTSPPSMSQSMVQKGYSQRLTSNVLDELNARANEISKLIKSPPEQTSESTTTTSRRHKRYSGIHRSKFNKMESISNHYSVSRNDPSLQQKSRVPLGTNLQNIPTLQFTSPKKDNFIPSSPFREDSGLVRVENMTDTPKVSANDDGKRNSTIDISSASKRRRTLNGPEEVANALPQSSPEDDSSSPTRRISPSKKSMNLNRLLNDGKEHSFVKPFPPSHKLRTSSLEMAGVKPPLSPVRSSLGSMRAPALKPNTKLHYESSNSHTHDSSNPASRRETQQKDHTINATPSRLQKQISNHQLQKKPSIPQLQKKSSIPQLQKKSSIPQLQKKSSIPQLQKKSSIPQLQKKPSIPKLQGKTSIPQLQKNQSRPSTLNRSESSKTDFDSNSSFSSRSMSDLYNKSVSSMRSLSSNCKTNSKNPNPSVNTNIPRSPSKNSLVSHINPPNSSRPSHLTNTSKVTIPEPFSLYDKPTLSSSQKSLGRLQRFRDKFN